MSPVSKRKIQEAQKNIVFCGALRAQLGALFDYEGGCSITLKWFLPHCMAAGMMAHVSRLGGFTRPLSG